MCLRRRDFYPPFHLLTTSFQVVADSDKVTPQPSLSSHCTPRVSSTTPLNSCSLIPSRASLPLSGHVKPESRLQTIRTQLRGSLERGQHKPLGSLAGLRTAQGLPALHHACYNNSLLSPAALTESQNHRIVGVGRDLCGSSSPTLLPKQGHLQQAAQDLVHTGLEYLQRRRLHNLPGQPVPLLRHPQREEVLPHVQTELPVPQFVPIAPCLVTGHH